MTERKRRAEARRAATARRRARLAGKSTPRAQRSATPKRRLHWSPTRSSGSSGDGRQSRRRRGRVAQARARHPASNTPVGRKPLSPRVKRRRVVLVTVFGALAVVGFLFAFVYPTSTFLHQRSEMGAAEQRIARIEAEAKRLEQDNKRLLTDAEVERLAREQYGLVRPGETPYALVPSSPTTVPPTTTPAPKESNK